MIPPKKPGNPPNLPYSSMPPQNGSHLMTCEKYSATYTKNIYTPENNLLNTIFRIATVISKTDALDCNVVCVFSQHVFVPSSIDAITPPDFWKSSQAQQSAALLSTAAQRNSEKQHCLG